MLECLAGCLSGLHDGLCQLDVLVTMLACERGLIYEYLATKLTEFSFETMCIQRGTHCHTDVATLILMLPGAGSPCLEPKPLLLPQPRHARDAEQLNQRKTILAANSFCPVQSSAGHPLGSHVLHVR